MLRALHALAVLLTALALVPAGAHLAEMPGKLALPREGYLLAQSLYRGWAWFGAVIIAAILANLALGQALRRRGQPGWRAEAAAGLLLAGLAVFFAWTFPANRATGNWLVLPPQDWEALRDAWEWSHAANAVLTFGALCLAVLSLPTDVPGGGRAARPGQPIPEPEDR